MDDTGEGCELRKRGMRFFPTFGALTFGGVELEIPLHRRLNAGGANPIPRAVNGDPNVLHRRRVPRLGVGASGNAAEDLLNARLAALQTC